MLKLFYFRSADGLANFGDDLNEWVWSRLLGDLVAEDADTLFTGIGTILNDRVPRAPRTVVFGSGVGFGGGLPRVDASWTFYCVRGPLSAQALGLPPALAITDPALLVSGLLPDESTAPVHRFSYMPHYRNASDQWAAICRSLGFGYIDPRHDRETVLAGIRRTRVLIAEAMHGAIVADSLGIPWISVRTAGAGTMEFKWRDWCGSLGLQHKPQSVVPIYASARPRPLLHVKSAIAAAQLFRISRTVAPQLSAESVRAERFEQLHERLALLKFDLQRENRTH